MAAAAAESAGGDQGGLHGSPEQQLVQAEAALAQLRLKYTDDHPDVIAVKKIIQGLQTQISAAPDKSDVDNQTPGVPNPAYLAAAEQTF